MSILDLADIIENRYCMCFKGDWLTRERERERERESLEYEYFFFWY